MYIEYRVREAILADDMDALADAIASAGVGSTSVDGDAVVLTSPIVNGAGFTTLFRRDVIIAYRDQRGASRAAFMVVDMVHDHAHAVETFASAVRRSV